MNAMRDFIQDHPLFSGVVLVVGYLMLNVLVGFVIGFYRGTCDVLAYRRALRASPRPYDHKKDGL